MTRCCRECVRIYISYNLMLSDLTTMTKVITNRIYSSYKFMLSALATITKTITN